MKIYLAARFTRQVELQEYAKQLQEDGHEITSTWVFGGEEGLNFTDIASLDVNDVLRADACLLFTEPYGTANKGGGRHTEFGVALATGKKLLVCGDREQVFCWFPGVTQMPRFDHIRNYLRGK